METWLTQILSSANGRHFRDDELNRLVLYVQSLPARLTACKELQDNKDLLQRQLLKTHAALIGHNSFAADLVDALIPIAQAMLLDDVCVLETKLDPRLHTLIDLMEWPPEDVEIVFQYLEETLSSRVSAGSRDLLKPCFAWNSRRIADALGAGRSLDEQPLLV